MAGVPLKFRCYQCNQLLGVSRSKIGTVVACPKCKADLIVPDPAEAEPAANGDDSGPAPAMAENVTTEEGGTLELLDIRPEDIRVEPGIAWTPAVELPPREPYSYDPPPVSASPAPLLVEADVAAPGLIDLAGPESESNATAAAVVPPIELESARISEPRYVAPRSRDVVLPRSAVAAWSVFVLVAQGLAFVAGLLAGHFLWRVH